jgi:hypothetical protein
MYLLREKGKGGSLRRGILMQTLSLKMLGK